MSQQLVFTVDRLQQQLRWCWLSALGLPEQTGAGQMADLSASLPNTPVQAWLLLPGEMVVTRELSFQEKEKKHLKTLLPFQIEETVIGDVDQFHFAFGPLKTDKVAAAWLDKIWLQKCFQQLQALPVEITRMWADYLTVPYQNSAEQADRALWSLELAGDDVRVRYGQALGFTTHKAHIANTLGLLLNQQNLTSNLPDLHLYAASDEELAQLVALLPISLADKVSQKNLLNPWQRDYLDKSINLGQGEFSQRLPIERWWKHWRKVALLAACCLATHVGIQLYQIHDLKTDNLKIRQAMEASYRAVVPQGAYVDAEKQLLGLTRNLAADSHAVSVVGILGKVLPELASRSGVQVRSIQYQGDSGEMNLQLQADQFDAIQSLRTAIEQKGLQAELLGLNAQGSSHSARLKISVNRP